MDLGNLLYGLILFYVTYLAIFRSKSQTAKALALIAMATLIYFWSASTLGTPSAGFTLAPVKPEPGAQITTVKPIEPFSALEVNLQNARLEIVPGPWQIEVTKKARNPGALTTMRLVSTRSGERLRLFAKGEGTNRSFSIKLQVPRPLKAKVEVANGSLQIEPGTAYSLSARLGNGEVTIDGFSPRADCELEVQNGTISLTDFAPEVPCRLQVINGEVDLAAKIPIRIDLRLTNGIVELPGQRSRRVAAGFRQTFGPENAPAVRVDITNGRFQMSEATVR